MSLIKLKTSPRMLTILCVSQSLCYLDPVWDGRTSQGETNMDILRGFFSIFFLYCFLCAKPRGLFFSFIGENKTILIQSSTEIQGFARCYINGDVMLKYFITHAGLFLSSAVIYYILSIPFYAPASFLHHFSSWHCYILTEAPRDNILTVQPMKLAFYQ